MCVLIVEDELLIRMGTAVMLEDAGCEVMCAGDADEAIELVDRHHGRFSALVTDLHMPGRLTGADVVQHMRRWHPDIPVCIASARADAVPEAWRLQYGVELLAKPYEPEALLRLLGKPASSLGQHRK